MVHIPEIFHNLSGESFVLLGYYEILKGIFICQALWFHKLNKPTDEVYER
jgi:hypothetical protein